MVHVLTCSYKLWKTLGTWESFKSSREFSIRQSLLAILCFFCAIANLLMHQYFNGTCQTRKHFAITSFSKSKHKKVGVLPIRIVKSNVSSVGPSSERNVSLVSAVHRPFYISICISTLPTQHTTFIILISVLLYWLVRSAFRVAILGVQRPEESKKWKWKFSNRNSDMLGDVLVHFETFWAHAHLYLKNGGFQWRIKKMLELFCIDIIHLTFYFSVLYIFSRRSLIYFLFFRVVFQCCVGLMKRKEILLYDVHSLGLELERRYVWRKIKIKKREDVLTVRRSSGPIVLCFYI